MGRALGRDSVQMPKKQVVAIMLQRMFIIVCLAFNTHASDVSITGQASEVLQRFRSRASVKSHVAGAISAEVIVSCQELHSRESMCIPSVTPPSEQDANTEQHGTQEQQHEDARQLEEEGDRRITERNREITTLDAILANVQSEEEEATDVLQRFRSRESLKSHVAGAISEEARASCVESQGLQSIEPISMQQLEDVNQQLSFVNRQLRAQICQVEERDRALHAILANVQTQEEEGPVTPRASIRV